MDSPTASWGKFPLRSWCFKSRSDGCFNLSRDRSKASAASRCTWCHPLSSGLPAKTAITRSSWSVTGIDDLQRFDQGNTRGREKTTYFPSQCCKVNLKRDCGPTISSREKMRWWDMRSLPPVQPNCVCLRFRASNSTEQAVDGRMYLFIVRALVPWDRFAAALARCRSRCAFIRIFLRSRLLSLESALKPTEPFCIAEGEVRLTRKADEDEIGASSSETERNGLSACSERDGGSLMAITASISGEVRGDRGTACSVDCRSLSKAAATSWGKSKSDALGAGNIALVNAAHVDLVWTHNRV